MKIKKVACVGAGMIGHGWATLYSSKGFEVILQDVAEDVLERAMGIIKLNLHFLERKNLLEKGRTEVALRMIKTTLSLADAVGQADYVTESVPDQYPTKKKVFKEMDAIAPEHTILASSSSGLLMTEIQKATTRPERCVLTHPILPFHLIPLVEIMGGEKTSRETIRATYDLMVRLGKVPVVLKKEVPGCIVNRLTAALLREAFSLVANEVASAEDVDRAFCMGIGLRDPIFGPFLRAHVAGGGIEDFIHKYNQSYSSRWKTMETWTSIPYSARKMSIESTNKMKAVRTKTLEEIERLRDEKLFEIIRDILPEHPFY